MENNFKSICITDYVRIRFKDGYITCPVNSINMSVADLRVIFESDFVPIHIYAICKKDNNRTVLITRDNYMKTEDELFPEIIETKVTEEPVQPPVPEIIKEYVEEKKSVAPVIEDAPIEETITVNGHVQIDEAIPETVVNNTVDELIVEDSNPEEVFFAGGNASSFPDEVIEEPTEMPVEEPVIEDVNTEEIKPETIEVKAPVNNRSQNYNKNKKKKNR